MLKIKSFPIIHVTMLTIFFLCLGHLFKLLGILGGKMGRSSWLEELAHIKIPSNNRIWNLNFILVFQSLIICQLMKVQFLKIGLAENGLTCIIYLSTDSKKILVVQKKVYKYPLLLPSYTFTFVNHILVHSLLWFYLPIHPNLFKEGEKCRG